MLISLIMNLMEYWIIIFLMQYICCANINLSRRNMILCTGINLLGTGIAQIYPQYYDILLHMALSVVLTVLLFSAKRGKDLLRFFPAIAIYFSLTVAPQNMLDELTTTQISLEFQDYTMTLFFLMTDVTLLISLIVLRYLLNRYRITLRFGVKEVLGGIALFFFSFIDVGLVIMLNRAKLQPALYYTFAVIFICAFVFAVGYYLYSLFEVHIRIYRQSIERNETEFLKLQLASLQNVKENEEQVKRMRHDLASHLAVIHSLCEEGSYEKVQKYTEQLSDYTILPDNRILTGNKVADLVVASRKKVCEEHGISFSFEGSLNNIKDVAAPDICGLFANAYDNAIEACLKQTDAYIKTRVNMTDQYTVIKIVNSVEKKVVIRNHSVVTTKKDKSSHGYGIDIMKRIANKYKGSVTLQCDEKEFEVKIVLLT